MDEQAQQLHQVQQLRMEVVHGAQALIEGGVLSGTKHGNWSVRIPGTDRILLTGSSLAGMKPEDLAVLTLDGEVVEGGLSSTSAEITRMHICVYLERPDVISVVHTHSPYSTAFAVANRPLECYAEILARAGSVEPIPLAKYGPRGSEESVNNIIQAMKESPRQNAVLLGNHGLLAFGPTVAAARHMVFAMEETAYAAILASSIGTPVPIPPQMALASQERRAAFEAAGTVSAQS